MQRSRKSKEDILEHGHIGRLATQQLEATSSKRYVTVVHQALPTPYVFANTTLNHNFEEAVKILKYILGERILYIVICIFNGQIHQFPHITIRYMKIYEAIECMPGAMLLLQYFPYILIKSTF